MDTHNLPLDQTKNLQQHADETPNPKRNRAWRRKTNYLHRGRDGKNPSTLWKPEKNFKLLYQRPVKQTRARQLGFDYPQVSAELFKRKAAYEYWNISD